MLFLSFSLCCWQEPWFCPEDKRRFADACVFMQGIITLSSTRVLDIRPKSSLRRGVRSRPSWGVMLLIRSCSRVGGRVLLDGTGGSKDRAVDGTDVGRL